jgi:hypothetical protein
MRRSACAPRVAADLQQKDADMTEQPEVSARPVRSSTSVLASRGQRENAARTLILLAAFASFLFSVSLLFSGNHQQGIFVGIWVPSILSLGGLLLPRGTAS